jgi:hypothetical protein
MLIYVNSFSLAPSEGVTVIINQIATWLGRNRHSYIDPVRLANGIKELRFEDGATISSLATLDDDDAPQYPYHFCARLQHGDPIVSGRRWSTEVGIRQYSSSDKIECSILLQTDEISARVNAPIQVTRPKIVELIVNNCSPTERTPGKTVISLTEDNAGAFLYEIEHAERSYPLVELSSDGGGKCPVSVERLRSILVGLAQVIEIPVSANTFKIEEIIGRKYSTFGGAINIIFPFKKTDAGGFCKTIRLFPNMIQEIIDSGKSVESEILAIITHQTNVPYSWRHISMNFVRQAVLRAKLKRAARAAHSSEEFAAYEALLDEAEDSLDKKDEEIRTLQEANEILLANLEEAQAKTDALTYALSGSVGRAEIESDAAKEALAPLRDTIQAISEGKPSLEQVLRLAAVLFSDRIVVLDSAIESAKESDRGGFLHGVRALELLVKLSTAYWSSLVTGTGDHQAKNVFGKNVFAAKEAETLSNQGRRRRTFDVYGKSALMEKHLKIGVKNSSAETLRIHFDWLGPQQKIVIGHCGKHLDF